MPTFQYEAMDNTGLEIKETIEATSEAEAQEKIREKGFFVTRIQEKGRSRKKAEAKKKPARRKGGTFSIGGVRPKQLCTFTRQLSTLQDAGLPIEELRVDGGAAANDLLMQFQADIIGVPVVRPKVIETTALGAAYLAGLSSGFWSSLDELSEVWQTDRVFQPQMPAEEVARRRSRWTAALDRARSWEQP